MKSIWWDAWKCTPSGVGTAGTTSVVTVWCPKGVFAELGSAEVHGGEVCYKTTWWQTPGKKMQKVRHRWKGSCAEGWKLHLSSSASINQLLMSHFQLKNTCIFSSVCPCMPQQSCHGRVCGAATLREPGGGVERLLWGQRWGGKGEGFSANMYSAFQMLENGKISPMVYLDVDFEYKHVDFLFWVHKGRMQVCFCI